MAPSRMWKTLIDLVEKDWPRFPTRKRSGYPTRATVRNDGAVRVARYEEQASAR